MVHVVGKNQAARYEESLGSHGGRITQFEVDLAFTILWDSWIVGKIFGDKHGAFESTGRHAIAFELLVRVGKVFLMVDDLFGSKYAAQLIVRHFSRILQSKLPRFTVRQGERSGKKWKLVESEAKTTAESVYGSFGVVLISELVPRSAPTIHSLYSRQHTGKMHSVCMYTRTMFWSRQER